MIQYVAYVHLCRSHWFKLLLFSLYCCWEFANACTTFDHGENRLFVGYKIATKAQLNLSTIQEGNRGKRDKRDKRGKRGKRSGVSSTCHCLNVPIFFQHMTHIFCFPFGTNATDPSTTDADLCVKHNSISPASNDALTSAITALALAGVVNDVNDASITFGMLGL